MFAVSAILPQNIKIAVSPNNQTPRKTIGIIGGADPAASCLLYKKIIDCCLSRNDCHHGEDFPEMVIINYPFARLDDLTDAKKNKVQLDTQLQYCIDKLAQYHVSFFAIACNTLHTFLSGKNLHGTNIVHIAQETLKAAQLNSSSKLLILATQTTIKKELYKQESIEVFAPNEQEQLLVNQIIDKVEQNKFLEEDAKNLIALINTIRKRTAIDGIVLGCTELSVLHEAYPQYFTKKNLELTVFDTTAILAQSIVNKAFAFPVS